MKKVAILAVALGVANILPASAQEFTNAGTVLELGQSAIVPHLVPKGPQVALDLKITAIEEGTAADLEGFEVPDNLKDARPIYVRYEYTNLSDEDLSHQGVGAFVAIDDRDQTHMPSLARGGSGSKIGACRPGNARNLTRGASHQGCIFFVIHKDGHLKAAAYRGGYRSEKGQDTRTNYPIYYDPIRWAAAAEKPAEPEKPAQGQIIAP